MKNARKEKESRIFSFENRWFCSEENKNTVFTLPISSKKISCPSPVPFVILWFCNTDDTK